MQPHNILLTMHDNCAIKQHFITLSNIAGLNSSNDDITNQHCAFFSYENAKSIAVACISQFYHNTDFTLQKHLQLTPCLKFGNFG